MGIQTHNGYVIMPTGYNYFPTTTDGYYGEMYTTKVSSSVYFITKAKYPVFIWQDTDDSDDTDYIQLAPQDGTRAQIRAKGTYGIVFSNMSSGDDKGIFMFTGTKLGVLGNGVPTSCRLSGDGSGIVLLADDNENKCVVMKYISATKNITFVNEAGETATVTLS